MKVFLTGAEGFIGSHLLEKLVKKGFSIKAFSKYHFQNHQGWIESIDKNILKKVEIINGDIRDPFEIYKAMIGCDYVINLAALIGIPYSYIAPKNYVDTNVVGTLNILEAAKKIDKVKKIILTSTSEVYGTAQKVPITEEHRLNAQSPYAATKVASDFLGISYYHSFNLPISIIRPFNTFGPRQSARAIIPSILIQVLSGQKKIKLGNLNPTRDFCFVDDTAEAFYKSLVTKKNISGKIINVSSGYEFSVREICQYIKQITKKEFSIITERKRIRENNSEVERLLGSNKKAKKYLDWKPKYIKKKGFCLGLKKTIDWFNTDENLSKYKKIYNL